MNSINTTNVYVIWKNYILLIQRSMLDENLPNHWESPAGHVDIYCPPIDSKNSRLEALRELAEETGIVAGIEDLHFLPQFSNSKHLSYALICNKNLPPKVKLSFEHDNFRWQKIDDRHLPTKIRPEVVNFIRSTQNV